VQLVQPFAESEETLAIFDHAGQKPIRMTTGKFYYLSLEIFADVIFLRV